ncbi:MAG: DinB family protein [Vicinamibacteria bacterium]|jgi:hypothetical protein|nr:DinB family protein [Vicinamibacteria bacterium]
MIDLAKTIRTEVESAAQHFQKFTEAEVTKDRGAGKWIKKEILGHLIDSAANNHQRFVRAQMSNPFVWPGYDQQVWVPLHRYRDRQWKELVDLWRSLNLHLAEVVAHVPADKLATPCVIGDRSPETLEWWMRDYLRHLRHHLAQIEGT